VTCFVVLALTSWKALAHAENPIDNS